MEPVGNALPRIWHATVLHLADWAGAGMEWIWQFANSSFFLALISASAGAFAGAYGATQIAEKKERQQRLNEEVRNTNAAIMVAFEVTNTFLAMKAQHVKDMKENFDSQKAAFEAFLRGRQDKSIPPHVRFEFVADFQTLDLVHEGSMLILRNFLFERISVGGRPLAMVSTLSRAVDGLNACIRTRNEIISSCKAKGAEPTFELPPIYFGAPTQEGHIDTTFPDTISGIASQTDDGIAFSKFIGEDLVAYGEKLTKSYKRNPPRINKPDFSGAEQKGLIPDSDLYADWLDAFRQHPTSG